MKYAYIPNDYNNNIVNEYMLWECRNLEMVDIDYQINKISPYAFAGDEKLKKLFLWGDTEVDDGTPISGTSSSTKNIKIINRATRDFELSIKDSIKGDSKIKNTDFALEDERLVYNYSKNRASVTDFELPYYVSIMIVESVMVSGTETNYMEIYIDDLDPSMFTIPSNTDIYTYSVYEVSSWDEDHELYRRNELLGTNSKYFPLDEVLYLTSNKPKIYLKEGSKDFDKSDLIVYALRRDGIILESDDWKEYTKHFARADNNITFERYNTQTNKDEEMVFDTYLPIALVDVSTENFESMTYSIDKRTSEIILNYVDKVTESDVDTDLNPTTDVNNAFTGASISIAIIAVLLILGIILVVISKKNKKIFSI